MKKKKVEVKPGFKVLKIKEEKSTKIIFEANKELYLQALDWFRKLPDDRMCSIVISEFVSDILHNTAKMFKKTKRRKK